MFFQTSGHGNVLDKLAAKLGHHRPRSSELDENDAESIVVEVTLDLDKHPPPELGPVPEGLSQPQVIFDPVNAKILSLYQCVHIFMV